MGGVNLRRRRPWLLRYQALLFILLLLSPVHLCESCFDPNSPTRETLFPVSSSVSTTHPITGSRSFFPKSKVSGRQDLWISNRIWYRHCHLRGKIQLAFFSTIISAVGRTTSQLLSDALIDRPYSISEATRITRSGHEIRCFTRLNPRSDRYEPLEPFVLNLSFKMFSVNDGLIVIRRSLPTRSRICYRKRAALFTGPYVSVLISDPSFEETNLDLHSHLVATNFVDGIGKANSPEPYRKQDDFQAAARMFKRKLGQHHCLLGFGPNYSSALLNSRMGFGPRFMFTHKKSNRSWMGFRILSFGLLLFLKSYLVCFMGFYIGSEYVMIQLKGFCKKPNVIAPFLVNNVIAP